MSSSEQLIAQANKAYALSSYEEAADKYAAASELLAEDGNDSPEDPNLMFLYGRALFKLAMQRSEVLGDSGPDRVPQADEVSKNAQFQFEGDAVEDEEEYEDEEGPQQAEEQPEDDFQTAWEVLDLARVLFQKRLDAEQDSSKTRKSLADTYDLLGEIALENGNSIRV